MYRRLLFLKRFSSFIKKKHPIHEFIQYNHYYKKILLSEEEWVKYKFGKCEKNFQQTFLPYDKAKMYWKILNPKQYAALARDKFVGHCLFDKLGIKSAKLLFVYCEETMGNDASIFVHSAEQVVNRINQLGVSCFVAKPSANSAHGQGVGVYCVSDFTEFGGDKYHIRDILHGTVLFESLIKQTPQVASFNSSSVNTIRVMTALYPNQEVKIFATFIKIGRAGSCVDNAGSGGNVDCAINIETGELYNALQFNSWEDVRHIDKHPDTGVQLNGVVIDDWNSIKNQVMQWQSQIPYLKTIGWDIAVTEEGPVVVEINNWWDTTGQLFLGEGWHPQVKACYDAWLNYKNRQK